MGGLLAIVAFVVVGGMLVFGGVQTLRSGLQISKDKVVHGPAGTVIGVLLIVLGVGLSIGAAITSGEVLEVNRHSALHAHRIMHRSLASRATMRGEAGDPPSLT